jgi:hypothetical protein
MCINDSRKGISTGSSEMELKLLVLLFRLLAKVLLIKRMIMRIAFALSHVKSVIPV